MIKQKIKQLVRSFRSTEQIFSSIYYKNGWSGFNSVSGRGSDDNQTQTVIEGLNKVLLEYKIHSLMDIPCGDFNWMKHVDLNEINYLGGDIVGELIKKNQDKFGSKNISFEHLDVIKSPLAKFDLILCRDCLVHLSFSQIHEALRNIKQSKSKYLLTTSFLNHSKNVDIQTGDWRTLNLEEHPFNLPKPILVLNENCTENNGQYADKSLCMWRIEELEL